MTESLKECPSGCPTDDRRWHVMDNIIRCGGCDLSAPVEVWQALPRTNDCAELVEALAALLAADPALRTHGIGAPHSPARNAQVARIEAEDKAKALLAKYKEPAQDEMRAFDHEQFTCDYAAQPDTAALVEALECFTTFAWTAVNADCDEARDYLNSIIQNARTALAKHKEPAQ